MKGAAKHVEFEIAIERETDELGSLVAYPVAEATRHRLTRQAPRTTFTLTAGE